MSNAVIKRVIIGPAVVLSIFMCGCGDSDKGADKLLTEARAQFEARDYSSAMTLLDSIDSSYSSAVAIRREAMALRPRIMEQLAVEGISRTDSLLAIRLMAGDSLSGTLVRIDNPVEPYFVPRCEAGVKAFSTPGLHAKVAPDGMFYMVATNVKPIKSRSVTVSSGAEEVSSPQLPMDGERNQLLAGNEVLTFISAECDTVAKFIVAHRNQPLTVKFNGHNASQTVKLTPEQVSGIADAYLTALTLTECKVLRLEKARLEKQLAVARSQIARSLKE